MNNIVIGMVAVGVLLIAGLLGAIMAESGWQNDCEKIGVHRVGQKVYDCKERAK